MTPMEPRDDPDLPSIMEQAAAWVARLDRGLTPQEQDEYSEWLRIDPRHRPALNRSRAALQRMMQLYDWTPTNTAQIDPDLFAPITPYPWRKIALWAASLALILSGAFSVLRFDDGGPPVAHTNRYLEVNDRLVLPDGSRVELRDDSVVLVRYSEHERRVILQSGEAHFSVWKDPLRPFVVECGDMHVTAVGTSFNVRKEKQRFEVLVTSGVVRVESPTAVPTEIATGHKGVVYNERTLPAPVLPQILSVSTDEIVQALAWQAPRLRFVDTPLIDAVRQFNQHSKQQLTLGSEELAGLRIGGVFRPDNVDAFVRLLELTFAIRSEERGENETVLWAR